MDTWHPKPEAPVDHRSPYKPPIAAPPLPGLRRASHRLQEEIVEIEVGLGDRHRVIVETMAGGKGHRPEPGELTVARRTNDGKSDVEHDLISSGSIDNPVSVPDFYATIHATMGADHTKNLYDGDRPVPVTDDSHPIARC